MHSANAQYSRMLTIAMAVQDTEKQSLNIIQDITGTERGDKPQT